MRGAYHIDTVRLMHRTNDAIRHELARTAAVINRRFPRLGDWDRRMGMLKEEAEAVNLQHFQTESYRGFAPSKGWPREVEQLRAYRRNTSALRAQDWQHDARARQVRANRFFDAIERKMEVVQEWRRRGETLQLQLAGRMFTDRKAA